MQYREEVIIVNRVIREDPTKSGMHNRQPITPKLLFKSMCDYDLWPLYLLGLTFQIPETTPQQYLTLTLKGLGFDTFKSNLLVIPSTVIHMISRCYYLSYLSLKKNRNLGFLKFSPDDLCLFSFFENTK